jgi:hypothetical protein
MPYRIRGSVVEEETGHPLGGLLVRAYDQDVLVDDFLGEARTDAAGHFEMVFTEVQFMDFHETRPDLYLQVFDASGAKLLRSTQDQVRSNAELQEHFEVRISRGKLPGS